MAKQSLEELQELVKQAEAEKAKTAEADALKAEAARKKLAEKKRLQAKANFIKEQTEKSYTKDSLEMVKLILEKRSLGVKDPEVALWDKFIAGLEKAKKSIK